MMDRIWKGWSTDHDSQGYETDLVFSRNNHTVYVWRETKEDDFAVELYDHRTDRDAVMRVVTDDLVEAMGGALEFRDYIELLEKVPKGYALLNPLELEELRGLAKRMAGPDPNYVSRCLLALLDTFAPQGALHDNREHA